MIVLIFNPFLPTGQFLAPKLIILIKCLTDIFFSKCCFNVSWCRTRCEIGIAIVFRSYKFKNSIEKWKKSGKKLWVNIKNLNFPPLVEFGLSRDLAARFLKRLWGRQSCGHLRTIFEYHLRYYFINQDIALLWFSSFEAQFLK